MTQRLAAVAAAAVAATPPAEPAADAASPKLSPTLELHHPQPADMKIVTEIYDWNFHMQPRVLQGILAAAELWGEGGAAWHGAFAPESLGGKSFFSIAENKFEWDLRQIKTQV